LITVLKRTYATEIANTSLLPDRWQIKSIPAYCITVTTTWQTTHKLYCATFTQYLKLLYQPHPSPPWTNQRKHHDHDSDSHSINGGMQHGLENCSVQSKD